jgi:hypothetical protein
MATYTTKQTASTKDAKRVHAGVNAVSVIYSLTASISAGDILQLVKVPEGAVIDDIYIKADLTGSAFAAVLGDGGDSDRFMAAFTLSAQGVVRASIGIPYSYSVSAYDTIDLVFSGVTSTTVAGSVSCTVLYHVDSTEGL